MLLFSVITSIDSYLEWPYNESCFKRRVSIWVFCRSAGARCQRAMLERLQKRYRPQIPQPLATGETGPLDLVDITQPPVESQPSQATLTKPTMTRAQQLLKKSHIVTAQQRVKVSLTPEFLPFMLLLIIFLLLFIIYHLSRWRYRLTSVFSPMKQLDTEGNGRVKSPYTLIALFWLPPFNGI